MRIIVALGGNMLQEPRVKSDYNMQIAKVEESTKLIINLVKAGHQIIITHGNGPQVGNLLIQQREGRDRVPALPLRILTAMTQTQIGVMLQHALINELKIEGIITNVITIPTSVIVDKNDPGFTDLTKPIGPFYDDEQYENLNLDGDEVYKRTANGMRRVVASPQPLEILEIETIKTLIEGNNLIIAVGGGGTPVIKEDGSIEKVDAVIDKDLASAVLADQVDADMLLILTNVEGVFTNFGKANEELHKEMSLTDAKHYFAAGEFGEGSMGPKVKACIQFLAKDGKRKAVITSPNNVRGALDGSTGTTFHA